MDLASNHRRLIEEIIRANPRYWGNEDLLESFCSDVYKKSYLLLDSVSNIDNLKSYLEKVVDTSVSSILKQNGRDDTPREKPDMSSVKADILDNPEVKEKINAIKPLKDAKIVSLRSDEEDIKALKGDIFGDIEDPKVTFPDMDIKESAINRIMSIVFDIHTKHPEKYYFQIFYSRHVRLKKQASIANELKITQGELSKRYFELIKLVKECL